MDKRNRANENGELSQRQWQQWTSRQQQLISNIELTLERDSQHTWTVWGESARQQKHPAQKSAQLSGFVKVFAKIKKRNFNQLSNRGRERHTDSGIQFLPSPWPWNDTSSCLAWVKEAECEWRNATSGNPTTMATEVGNSLIGGTIENPQLRGIWTWRKQEKPVLRLAKRWERQHSCSSWLQASSGRVMRTGKDWETRSLSQWAHRETGGVEWSEQWGSRCAMWLSCTKPSTGWLEWYKHTRRVMRRYGSAWKNGWKIGRGSRMSSTTTMFYGGRASRSWPRRCWPKQELAKRHRPRKKDWKDEMRLQGRAGEA